MFLYDFGFHSELWWSPMEISVQLLPALHVGRAGISVFPKEHQNLITEAHYILATISLKFRARITKFQGDIPEALKRGISLVRLVMCTDHVKLTSSWTDNIDHQDLANAHY